MIVGSKQERHLEPLVARPGEAKPEQDADQPAEHATAPPPRPGTACSTSRSSAPIASRMPISRVRSVTETSMMFMMPMPPTSRLTAGDRAEQRRSCTVVVATVRLRDLLHVADGEVVVLAGRDVAALAQQSLDVGLDLGGVDAVLAPTRRSCRRRGCRRCGAGTCAAASDDHVVLVLADARLALGARARR